MSELDMNPATLPADAQALYEKMAARRKAQGEGFGGPYLALLNHPELARRIEELGFFLKFEGALPRTIYQFIVLTGGRDRLHRLRAHRRAAAALRPRARDPGEDDDMAVPSRRFAGASHYAVGQTGIDRNRGAVGLLSDVRRHQPGIRYQAAVNTRVSPEFSIDPIHACDCG
jgi:hypothetical protein